MTSNTKKVLAALALMFVGYTIGEDAPTALGANYTTPAQSDVSNELDRLTQTPAHEPWSMNYTVEHNTVSGEGGWVMTEVGIPHNHECVIHVSVQPYKAIVVRDSSVLCEQEAVSGDADTEGSFRLPEDSDDPRYDCARDGNRICAGDPEAIGDAPRYTEIHGDTRGRQSTTPARPAPSVEAEKPKPAPVEKPVAPSEPSAAPAKPAAPSSGLVNLNTASQSELEALPGIGEKTAQKIIAARPLASVGAVDAMPGVRFAEFKDLVTV